MPQFFKESDAREKQFYFSAQPTSDDLSLQKDLFFEGAYDSFILGEVLYDTKRAPLTNAIAREIFRTAFQSIFESFIAAGTFESYLLVFKTIFGEDVLVEFDVPAPGKLNIDIVATGVEQSDWIARHIEDNAYIFDDIVDEEDDEIVFQSIKGFASQYELEQMLFEMVPGGIFTTISLTLGA